MTHATSLCRVQPCDRFSSSSSGMLLVAGRVWDAERKSWASFLHLLFNKSLTSFFMTILSQQLYYCKEPISCQISCPFFDALLSTNPLTVCRRFFAFSKYLAVSKLLYSSGLSYKVFRVISLYQNSHWRSFHTFYVILSLTSVSTYE